MKTVAPGDLPSMPNPAADRRSLAIQVVRAALDSGPETVAWQLGLAPDQFKRALASAVAEFKLVTAGIIDAEQGARIGSEGLAASIRIAGIRIVAAQRTPRANCDQRSKMEGVHGRLIAIDECHTRHGALNA